MERAKVFFEIECGAACFQRSAESAAIGAEPVAGVNRALNWSGGASTPPRATVIDVCCKRRMFDKGVLLLTLSGSYHVQNNGEPGTVWLPSCLGCWGHGDVPAARLRGSLRLLAMW